MVKQSVFLVASAAILVTLAMATPANAQPTDQRTYFTFSGPVTLPNVTLPPGKYLFRIADTASRQVVQVLSADGRQLYATLLAISATRIDVPGQPEVRFMEAPATVAPPVKTWWYPGDTTGHEFIYPREQARRIAAAAEQPVLTTHAEVPVEEMKSAELARVAPGGEEVAVEAPPEAPKGALQAGTPAPETLMLPQAPPATTPTRAELPGTASPLPLIGLMALLSLAGALALSLRKARH